VLATIYPTHLPSLLIRSLRYVRGNGFLLSPPKPPLSLLFPTVRPFRGSHPLRSFIPLDDGLHLKGNVFIWGGESKTTYYTQFTPVPSFVCPPSSLRSLSTIALRFIPLRPRPPSLNFFSLPLFLATSFFFFLRLPNAIIYVVFETLRFSRRLFLSCLFPLRFFRAPRSAAGVKTKLFISFF